MEQEKILIVDDDIDVVHMLAEYFTLKGYSTITAYDGEEAINKLKFEPSIILLDINMPKINGLDVCKKIRNMISCPILFLTARVAEQDRINGLHMGGDDYILKPFSLRELEARVQAHLNREKRSKKRNSVFYSEGLMIDYSAKKVFYNEEEILFTSLEFRIIEFMSQNAGRVFDKGSIYERINGFDSDADSRVITVLISRIRKKMQDYSEWEWIETVWGIGYRWKK